MLTKHEKFFKNNQALKIQKKRHFFKKLNIRFFQALCILNNKNIKLIDKKTFSHIHFIFIYCNIVHVLYKLHMNTINIITGLHIILNY